MNDDGQNEFQKLCGTVSEIILKMEAAGVEPISIELGQFEYFVVLSSKQNPAVFVDLDNPQFMGLGIVTVDTEFHLKVCDREQTSLRARYDELKKAIDIDLHEQVRSITEGCIKAHGRRNTSALRSAVEEALKNIAPNPTMLKEMDNFSAKMDREDPFNVTSINFSPAGAKINFIVSPTA